MIDSVKPVIGLLSQEISRKVIPENIDGGSYISAAYVKYIEEAGADVLPIQIDWDDHKICTIFKSINGVLIPGGGANLEDSKFMRNVRLIFKLAEDANDAGDYFPIWGTCLGLEAMLVMHGGASLLNDADAIDLAMPTKLLNGARQSRIFSAASCDLLHLLATLPVKYHFHRKCVYKDTFLQSQELTEKYTVVSFDEDRQKRVFVSTLEGKQYPFYGVQWHPEKVKHETIPGLNVPKCAEAMRLSTYVGKFFVNEARKNHHTFSSKEMKEKYLIKNYHPVYTGDLGRIQYSYIFN